MFGLQTSYDRLDGGATPQLAFDLLGDALPLARDEHPELVFFGSVVAAIAAVGDEAFDRRADLFFHFRDYDAQRVAVVRIARQRLHMRDELSAL